MADPTPTAVRDAIKTIIRTVANVGSVAESIAQEPPWIAAPTNVGRPFVTVRFAGEARAPYAAPRRVGRQPTFVVDIWLPIHADTNTEERHDNLCLAVQAALQNERTLGDVVDDAESPQLEMHEPEPYWGAPLSALCHHGRIILQVTADIQYSAP